MSEIPSKIGDEIHQFAYQMWSFNRSLTGDGVTKTLDGIKKYLPNLKIKRVASGKKALDWEIPKEWSVEDAYIVSPSGETICDFKKNNLHLVGYSSPIEKRLDLNELKKHLFTLPEQPDAIPYVTSYYKERWGFCITYNQFKNLVEGEYYVKIKSRLFDGFLQYGELIIPGNSSKEVFLSSYICHPSMANNELSGPTVLTYIAKWLNEQPRLEHSYRIIFIPETIGSIAYISQNLEVMKKNIFAGFNISCIGDNRAYSYLPSRSGNTLSDHVAKHVLGHIDPNYKKYTWFDRGSDERQYCAPGVDLPIASLMRTKYGEYPEYHTSLDNLENVVTSCGLDGGYWAVRRAIELIEKNKKYSSTYLCEPQMGKRNLYPTISTKKTNERVKLMMDILSMCDGQTTVLEIADLIRKPAWQLYEIFDTLEKNELIFC